MAKKTTIVEATGNNPALYTTDELDAAMNAAAAQAKAEGVTAIVEIRERKLAAKQAFTDERRARLSAEAEAKAQGISDPKEIEKLVSATRKRFEDQRKD